MMNEIMRNLATPTSKMFEYVYQILKDQCDIIFEDFIGSKKEIIFTRPSSINMVSENEEKDCIVGCVENILPHRRPSCFHLLRGLLRKQHSI